MTEPQAREIIENYLEGYNLFDVAGMLSCLHPAVVFENVTDGSVTLRTNGKDAFEAQATKALALFMERNQSILAICLNADCARVDIKYFAISAIDWPNGLKAGAILQLTGQSVFTFRDGLIASIQDIS
ncbi:nuclear transport factor 2 family protein [Hymenobacter sp. UYCo722]|uniref:nuclear transport factor 2 family protein n=1 Tax=Hymenobacter sp. UYCo722 TaxID=3156335 RepID=UPI003395BF9C